jgi:hypothetical protein
MITLHGGASGPKAKCGLSLRRDLIEVDGWLTGQAIADSNIVSEEEEKEKVSVCMCWLDCYVV